MARSGALFYENDHPADHSALTDIYNELISTSFEKSGQSSQS